jgi:hypothetical protein
MTGLCPMCAEHATLKRMRYATRTPEALRERLAVLDAKRRQIRMLLRLAEAERRDRERLQQAPQGEHRE